mmetsp:Transcript_7930/g.12988  ORF Transcript_7930/g.12988 Transcript_7930/m.12988 type:complete len:323 (+) Transcript_7930:104-1072(+)|eukprot:CAMPEP_0169228302 /NCGR_PEP_ID=MMETSP1016-20121227/24764_1 /TAXON_ID=342587 /ORGANISM="Karlodinium micrum, Strain CCMP2283" /LENGTH=322 /DNA_ID=CAMNT_0009307077 /DNA_START=91 /DNA_END=1059 /DNA_ORIENTATION=+
MSACRVGTSDSSGTRSSFYSAVSSNRTVSSSGSGPDPALIASFVAELGIEESEEDEFAWIAEFGLRADLPPGWSSRTDAESGATYFVDIDSLASTWENPLTPHLRRLVEIGRRYSEQKNEIFFEDQKALLWQEHKAELEIWHGPVQDEEGNSYFVNSRDGISSWQDPRLSRAHIFDLQCSLLRHLQTVLSCPADSRGFEGGTSWETADGAQVLTLDTTQVIQGSPSRRLPRRVSLPKHDDYSFALKQMSNAAEWLHDARKSEEEIQRMKLLRKVEERRMRQLNRKLRESINGTAKDEKNEKRAAKPLAYERRPISRRAAGRL